MTEIKLHLRACSPFQLPTLSVFPVTCSSIVPTLDWRPSTRLVLPEGERSAWDDILTDVLLKAPPANPLRWRGHRLSADGAAAHNAHRAAVGTGGALATRPPLDGGGIHRDQEHEHGRYDTAMPPPPPTVAAARPVAASTFSGSSPSSSSLLAPGTFETAEDERRSGRASSGFDVDSGSDDQSVGWRQGRTASGGSNNLDDRRLRSSTEEPVPAPLPEVSLPSPSRKDGQELGAAELESESAVASSWTQRQEALAMSSSADETMRERMSKFTARRQARQAQEQLSQQQQLHVRRPSTDDEMAISASTGAANMVATGGRRHLLRGPGSWTSGGGGVGGPRSPMLSRSGSTGGSSSLGSPRSSSNLVVTQAALGNLTNNLASMKITSSQPTSGNRESRRQSISRRLSRGASMGAGRVAVRDAPDLGAVEEAEAVALGASPAAARAAAEAAAASATLAIRRRVVEQRLANRRSLSHEVAVEAQEEQVGLGAVLHEGVVDHRRGDDGGRRSAKGSRSPRPGRPGRLLPAEAVLESEEEEYATPRDRRGSSPSIASSRSSAGGSRRRQQDRGQSVADSDTSRERGGGGDGRRFFPQRGDGSQGSNGRYSAAATPVSWVAGGEQHSFFGRADRDYRGVVLLLSSLVGRHVPCGILVFRPSTPLLLRFSLHSVFNARMVKTFLPSGASEESMSRFMTSPRLQRYGHDGATRVTHNTIHS